VKERIGGACSLGALVTAYGLGGIVGAGAYAVLVRVVPGRRVFAAIRVAYRSSASR
jgi:hypothetical protein